MNATLQAWLASARDKVKQAAFSAGDLDALEALLAAGEGFAAGQSAAPTGTPRQRLLYLTCSGMSVLTPVVAWDFREPTRQAPPTRLTPGAKPPYPSVHDAIVDGWRVIHFPDRQAPLEDREVNIWGYEFILEKVEVFHD